jgi:hypothetical protein
MSESRSNQPGQAGMAILIIVVLFGGLFLGGGGLVWVRVRAQRAAVEDAMRMAEQARYQEELARERAAAATPMVEEARDSEQVQSTPGEAATVVGDTPPTATNAPTPANEGEVQNP